MISILEGAIMLAALISRYTNGGVFPWDRSGREGHFEASTLKTRRTALK
jgi:hypothetical protein